MSRPRLLHVTSADLSLDLLLGPQLQAFAAAGYEVLGASAPGPYVEKLEADGIGHVSLDHATRGWSLSTDARALSELRRAVPGPRSPTSSTPTTPSPASTAASRPRRPGSR